MKTVEERNKFFEEWANLHHTQETDDEYYEYHKKKKGEKGYIPKDNFYYDGILFEDKYANASKKILFIAKECNAYDINKKYDAIDKITTDDDFWARNEVTEIAENRASYSVFLHGLAMLANAILNNNYTTPNKDITALYNAALINLNKRGGYNYCVWETLEGYVKKYQKQIRKQIDYINPDEIVCCGESVNKLVKQYHLADNRIVKCAFHPSYFAISDKAKILALNGKELESKTDASIDGLINDRNTRGYILDTNNYYCKENEHEMMRESKACAYGDARHYLGWYRRGDYVLFYSSDKKGIIAVGKVETTGENDFTDTDWWTVTPIVPKDFKSAIDCNSFLPIEKVNRIVYGNDKKKICMRGTVKRKIINETQVKSIINELKKKYNEQE